MTQALRTHSTVFLAASLALLAAWPLLGVAASSPLAVLVLGGAVLILGLPHGALDLWVARKVGFWGGEGGFVRFHLVYLALAALVVAGFVLLPILALIGFLGLSLWHFGDDWRRVPPPLRLACAGVIVLVPSLLHPQAVADIFAAVTGQAAGPVPDLPYLAYLVGGWVVAGTLVAAWLHDRRSALEVGTLVLLAAALPPLVFFAAYFTLLHGPRHMIRHGRLLEGRAARPVLIAYTLAALGIVAVLGWWLSMRAPAAPSADVLRALFVGLAALTVPHAFLMAHDKRLSEKANIGEAATI